MLNQELSHSDIFAKYFGVCFFFQQEICINCDKSILCSIYFVIQTTHIILKSYYCTVSMCEHFFPKYFHIA